MTEAGAMAAHSLPHIQQEDHGFLRTYLFSTDHKMIGRQFMIMSLLMLVLGGLMAMMMRWELAWPESVIPFTSWIPDPYMYEGRMDPAFYNSLFTMHATIMIFFVIMPFLVGGFGNFLLPLMIGASDAFVLGGRPSRIPAHIQFLRPRRGGSGRLDNVCYALRQGAVYRRGMGHEFVDHQFVHPRRILPHGLD